MVYNSGLARLTKKLRRFRNIFAMLPKSDVVAAGRLAGDSKHKTSDTPTFVCTSSTFGDTRLKIRKKFAVIFFLHLPNVCFKPENDKKQLRVAGACKNSVQSIHLNRFIHSFEKHSIDSFEWASEGGGRAFRAWCLKFDIFLLNS